MTEETSRREFERALTILRRRARLILAITVIGAAAAFGFSVLQQKEYSATSTLLFRDPGYAEELFGTVPSQTSPEPRREAATNERLVGMKVVATRTAQRLNGLTPQQVSDMVQVESEGEAELVSVIATSSDKEEARRVANTFAHEFISFRADTDRAKLVQAKQLAEKSLDNLSSNERSGPRGQALSRGIEKLGILASLQTGNAELVQPAELPTSPSSPKTLRNAVIGGLLGLLVGILVAVIRERLDYRLREPKEAEEIFGVPLLGTVPQSAQIPSVDSGQSAPSLPFVEEQAFQILLASLRYFNVDRDLRSVVVASDGAGVGKSTVSWNLARVAAMSSKAILVEADLRNPSIAMQHRLASGPGLADILIHEADLDGVIQRKVVKEATDESSVERKLDVIVAGAHPPNPSVLLESNAMSELLATLGDQYDFIVVDTAPLGVVSDAFPLLRQVGGVIAVARMNQSTRASAQNLASTFSGLKAPVLGFVANAVRSKKGSAYGYGYYGGYAQSDAASGTKS